MSEFRGHPKELEQLFPGASISALANLPAGFAQDQGKARAFIATWARAEAYAGLLEQHLNNLNRSYRTPDSGNCWPVFSRAWAAVFGVVHVQDTHSGVKRWKSSSKLF